MNSLKKYEDFFSVLAKAKPQLRKALLIKADNSLIKAIIEVVLNTLNGNLHVPKQDVQKMRKHRKVMRQIASHKKRGIKAQRKRIVQYGGGFLPHVCKAFLNGLRGNDACEQGRILCPQETRHESCDNAPASSAHPTGESPECGGIIAQCNAAQ